MSISCERLLQNGKSSSQATMRRGCYNKLVAGLPLERGQPPYSVLWYSRFLSLLLFQDLVLQQQERNGLFNLSFSNPRFSWLQAISPCFRDPRHSSTPLHFANRVRILKSSRCGRTQAADRTTRRLITRRSNQSQECGQPGYRHSLAVNQLLDSLSMGDSKKWKTPT